MALSTVIAQLTAAATPLMPQGTSFLTGRELVAGEDAPPRVVYAYGPNDEFDAAWNSRVPAPPVPRVRLTRRAGLEVFLWGTTYDQAESMVNAMVNAIYEVALGSMKIVAGTWADVGFTSAGRAYRLTLTIDVPITEPMPIVGQASTAPIDLAFNH